MVLKLNAKRENLRTFGRWVVVLYAIVAGGAEANGQCLKTATDAYKAAIENSMKWARVRNASATYDNFAEIMTLFEEKFRTVKGEKLKSEIMRLGWEYKRTHNGDLKFNPQFSWLMIVPRFAKKIGPKKDSFLKMDDIDKVTERDVGLPLTVLQPFIELALGHDLFNQQDVQDIATAFEVLGVESDCVNAKRQHIPSKN